MNYNTKDLATLINHVVGIASVKKRIKKKDETIRTATSNYRSIMILGAVLFILGVVCCFVPIISPFSQYIAAVGIFFAVCGIFGCFQYRKTLKNITAGSGRLTVGPEGIRDIAPGGLEYKYPWDVFEFAVISQKATVFFFNSVNMFIFIPTTPETEFALISALSYYGKSDSIYRRKVK